MSLVPRNLSNNSLRNEDGNHASTIIFPQKTRCEFCSINFKCDLDVARHLNSPTHRTKRDEHLSLLNKADKTLEKNIPNNLKKVYDSLKVRTVKDLHDLADKDYFSIPHESFMSIYDSLVDKLFASVVNFETKNLKDTSFRDKLLQTLESRKTEPEKVPQASTSSATATEGENVRHDHEVIDNQLRKKAKTNKTSRLTNIDETTKASRQPPKSSIPAKHSKQNGSIPSSSSKIPRGKAPHTSKDGNKKVLSTSKSSSRKDPSSSSGTSGLRTGRSGTTRSTGDKTPSTTSNHNTLGANSSAPSNASRLPKNSAPPNLDTLAPRPGTRVTSPGVTPPSSGGPTLGQNWDHKFTFAKIKTEPKD